MEQEQKNPREIILQLLKEKSVMKQDVYSNTIEAFNELKEELLKEGEFLSVAMQKIDKRVNIYYKDVSIQSAQLKVAGDIIDFQMHSNVFEFDHSHPIFKTGYVRNDEMNAFCGIISVYNFLADSYKYNRMNDLGYLIARIFINREKKFFVETRTQIGYRYAQFSQEPVSRNDFKDLITEMIIYVISFDLFTPPYDSVRQVSVAEMMEKSSASALRTGKRLGYAGTTDEGSPFDDEATL